jgi:hypothetical protein
MTGGLGNLGSPESQSSHSGAKGREGEDDQAGVLISYKAESRRGTASVVS